MHCAAVSEYMRIYSPRYFITAFSCLIGIMLKSKANLWKKNLPSRSFMQTFPHNPLFLKVMGKGFVDLKYSYIPL